MPPSTWTGSKPEKVDATWRIRLQDGKLVGSFPTSGAARYTIRLSQQLDQRTLELGQWLEEREPTPKPEYGPAPKQPTTLPLINTALKRGLNVAIGGTVLLADCHRLRPVGRGARLLWFGDLTDVYFFPADLAGAKIEHLTPR